MFGLRKKAPSLHIAAVVVAAGSAARMGGIDKQQAPIDEVPVVIRSLEALEASRRVTEIVLVCREEMIPQYYALVQDYRMRKVSSVVGGGATRQDSVFRGIGACSSQSHYFAIHDGCRPMVEEWLIEQCIDAALEHGAAAAGVPVKDTIKVRDEKGFISSTPDRSTLVAIQTPQIFEAAIYRRAMEVARKSGCCYTDDCQLVEHTGHPVFISPGSYENIKITTPDDLVIAEALLAYREEGASAWLQCE